MGYSLDLLKQIAHGLAQQFGDSCEIVIHDVRHETQSYILKTDMSLTENPVIVHPMSYWKRSKPIGPHYRISTLIWQKQMTDVCWSLRLFTLRTNPERLPIFFLSIMILPHWLQRISFCSPLSRHRIPPSHPLPAVQPLRLRTMSPSFWIPWSNRLSPISGNRQHWWQKTKKSKWFSI